MQFGLTPSHPSTPEAGVTPGAGVTLNARTTIVRGALLAAFALVVLTLAYAQQAWRNPSLTWGVATILQALLTLATALGTDLTRQRHSGWGAGLISVGLLGTLAVLASVFENLGAALVVIILLAAPALATQVLPPRLADQATRTSLSAGLIIGLLTLFPPLPLVKNNFITASLPVWVLLATVPYLALVGREFQKYNLRAKLILAFSLVALVPLALLAFLNDRATRTALTEAANQALTNSARTTANTIDNFFENARTAQTAEAQLTVFRNYLQLPSGERTASPQSTEITSLLNIFKNKDTRLRHYALIDATTGRVLISTQSAAVGQNLSVRDYVFAPVRSADFYASPVSFYEGAPQGQLYLSAPVLAADNTVLGLLIAQYDAEAVLQPLIDNATSAVGSDSFAILLDENHIRLADGGEPGLRYQAVTPLAANRLLELQSNGRLPAPALTTNLPDFEQALTQMDTQPTFSAIAHPDDVVRERGAAVATQRHGWIVVVVQPETVFLAPVAQQTRLTIVFAVLVSLLMIVVALGIAQVLAMPILRLTRATRKAAEGDLSVQAVVETQDEVGDLAVAFNVMTTRLNDLVNTLGTRVVERTSQLRAAAEIGRATSSLRDLNQLLPLALELIRERFGFYHASIFLLDDARQFAVLRESIGEAGRVLKARQHQLAVGSRSLVGTATATRKPVVVQDVTRDPTHFKNPLLPDTRGEAVIPLMSGDRLLGALDVQSNEPEAFDEDMVQILQTLADQLGVAIENAELFQRTQASLAEVSSLYEKLTRSGWRALARGQAPERVFNFMPGAVAAESTNPVLLPLEIQGQSVGVIELHGRTPESLTPEEQAVLEALRAQLSVALESAALLEETQRRTRYEQLLNQITYQMRATLNPDSILQSGIRELGRALGATEVVVSVAEADAPSGQREARA